MTATTDTAVSFTLEAQHRNSGWQDLDVVNIIPSMDMDRVPYCTATITVVGVDYETVQTLDPRIDNHGTGERGNVLRFRVLENDGDGDFRANLVQDLTSPSTQWAYAVIRAVGYNPVTQEATITVGGRESILDDRIRNSTTTIDTAATSVLNLVYWSLLDTFSSYIVSNDSIVSSTSIPAGDRRLMLQGESHSDLLEPELQAIGCRLYDYWGDGWYANERENTPRLGLSWGYDSTIHLASYSHADGAPANADPIIYDATERFDRGGDYADGVLIKFDELESGGSVTYQRSGTGENSRGRVLTWNRARPANNAADQVVARTRIRGRDITITARARLDVSPGQDLVAHFRGGTTIAARIRAVEWDIAAGEMTITAQSGIPEE